MRNDLINEVIADDLPVSTSCKACGAMCFYYEFEDGKKPFNGCCSEKCEKRHTLNNQFGYVDLSDEEWKFWSGLFARKNKSMFPPKITLFNFAVRRGDEDEEEEEEEDADD